jgi:hypothetical protein
MLLDDVTDEIRGRDGRVVGIGSRVAHRIKGRGAYREAGVW